VKTAQAVLKVVEWEQEPDRRALERDLSEFMEIYLYRPLKELRVGDLLQEFLSIISKHRLLIPADLYLMIKSLTEMEGLGLRLDPDFDMVEKATPYIRQIKMQKFSPGRIASEILESGGDLVQLAKAIPGELRDILSQIKQGKIRIGLEHRGIDEFIEELDRSSNGSHLRDNLISHHRVLLDNSVRGRSVFVRAPFFGSPGFQHSRGIRDLAGNSDIPFRKIVAEVL